MCVRVCRSVLVLFRFFLVSSPPLSSFVVSKFLACFAFNWFLIDCLRVCDSLCSMPCDANGGGGAGTHKRAHIVCECACCRCSVRIYIDDWCSATRGTQIHLNILEMKIEWDGDWCARLNEEWWMHTGIIIIIEWWQQRKKNGRRRETLMTMTVQKKSRHWHPWHGGPSDTQRDDIFNFQHFFRSFVSLRSLRWKLVWIIQ